MRLPKKQQRQCTKMFHYWDFEEDDDVKPHTKCNCGKHTSEYAEKFRIISNKCS